MKLTTKSEYACLAIIYLATHHGEGFVKSKVIAQKQKIPPKYLEQILMILNRGGFVRSERGLAGGYCLAQDPQKISVAQVVRLMDGALAPVGSVSKYFYSHTPIEKSPKLLAVFREIRDFISEKLEHTTFADLTVSKKK